MISFLSLPAEIRREIYRLCRTSQPIERVSDGLTYRYNTFGPSSPILRVNRQIRDEAMADIYGTQPAKIFVDPISDVNFGPLRFAAKYVPKLIVSFRMCKALHIYPNLANRKLKLPSKRALRPLIQNVEKIALWLKEAKSLRSLELQWDEDVPDVFCTTPFYLLWASTHYAYATNMGGLCDQVIQLQGLLLSLAQPLCHSPNRVEISKGPVSINSSNGYSLWLAEMAFSNVVDAIIDIRKKSRAAALDALVAKKSLGSS